MESQNLTRNANGKRKVYYKFTRRRLNNWVKHPVIRLSGAYLQDYGFKCGDEIEVAFEQDRIVITKLPLESSP